MRSNNPKIIDISVVRERATLPGFLSVFQRHFEKANPAINTAGKTTEVNAPIDLLSLTKAPAALTSGIESLSVIYSKA